MSAAQASPCSTKYSLIKMPGRYLLAPLPQGMVILRGFLSFLSRVGCFRAFLILGLCFIFTPNSVIVLVQVGHRKLEIDTSSCGT